MRFYQYSCHESQLPAFCRKSVSRFFVLMLLVSGAAAFFAASATAAGSIEQLRTFVSETQSASGKFQQTGASLGPDEASSGDFAFARPGKFRWSVIEPYEQLLVANGAEVFFHDIDLNQVTVRPMSGALGATPAAILFGTGDVDERFIMTEEGESGGLEWLAAVPKEKEAGFERIRIGFNNSLPVAMEVLDAFNNTSRFVFSDLQTNPNLDEAMFRFEVPEGTDVVRP